MTSLQQGLRQVGSSLIGLGGPRARMERSSQANLHTYADELRGADLTGTDTFVALIQCVSDLRFPPGRAADLCGVSTRTVKGWIRGRDLPDSAGQADALYHILSAIEERVRIAPDLSLPDQAASGSASAASSE